MKLPWLIASPAMRRRSCSHTVSGHSWPSQACPAMKIISSTRVRRRWKRRTQTQPHQQVDHEQNHANVQRQ